MNHIFRNPSFERDFQTLSLLKYYCIVLKLIMGKKERINGSSNAAPRKHKKVLQYGINQGMHKKTDQSLSFLYKHWTFKFNDISILDRSFTYTKYYDSSKTRTIVTDIFKNWACYRQHKLHKNFVRQVCNVIGIRYKRRHQK